jgi:DNA-binding beta-propeller fold protein YncE
MRKWITFFLCLPLLVTACGPIGKANPPLVTITAVLAATEAVAPGTAVALGTAALEAGTPAAPSIPVEVPPADNRAPMWVANPTDQAVLRIDPRTETVALKIAVDGQPEQVVTGEGAVWALDRQNGVVFRIDPQTNRVTDRIVLPDGKAESIAGGAGSIWVGMTGRIDSPTPTPEPGQVVEVQPPGWVLRIDPASAQVVDRMDVQPVSQLAARGNALWVLSRGTIDTPLQMIDLVQKQGLAVPLRDGPDWLVIDAMAVDANELWLFSAGQRAIFRSTLDGRITAAIRIPEGPPNGYADLLLAGDSLWAATPWGSVLRIDPRTNRVAGQANLGHPLSNLLSGGGSVWAYSRQDGVLFRLDATGNKITGQIATGSRVQPTVIPTATSSVTIWQPCADAPASRLKVGDIAYVNKENDAEQRVRKDPTTKAEIIGTIRPGAAMTIIGGPTCADGWVWWNVHNADLTGWSAEGDKDVYWLMPLWK